MWALSIGAILVIRYCQVSFNFLKNTIDIYKKIFKNSLIIISTWENENIDLINTLKDQNIYRKSDESSNTES